MFKLFFPQKTLAFGLILICLTGFDPLMAQCPGSCSYAGDYCGAWDNRLNNNQFRIDQFRGVKKSDVPLSQYPAIWQYLDQFYVSYLQNIDLMRNTSDPCSLVSCLNCNSQSGCGTTCLVEPCPLTGQSTFLPNEVITSSAATQVIHFGFSWPAGMMAIPGVDRITAQNGASNVFVRLSNDTCDNRVEDFNGTRCFRSLMSDFDDSIDCLGDQSLWASIPNFQGDSLYMVGGTLGISHMASLVCTIANHSGNELTVKMPMDAMYTNWFLSMQDFYRAATGANMINQFMDEFVLLEFQSSNIVGAGDIFGPNTSYDIRFLLEGQEMRRYGNPSGKTINIELLGYNLAGDDQYIDQPGSVVVGNNATRTDYSYQWDSGICGVLQSAYPSSTTTFTLKAISPIGFLATDSVTVFVGESDLAVTDVSITATNVYAGDTVSLTATIANPGNQVGQYDHFFIEANGQILWISPTPVVVQPGQSVTVTAQNIWSPLAGEYTLRAAGARWGDRPDDNDAERTIPVWDGVLSNDALGLYRPSNANYYLDANDNGVIDLAGGDFQFVMGQGSDIPIAGDWNGNGVDTIGLFRPNANVHGANRFYLDMDGDGAINLTAGDLSFFMGQINDLPIAGDWNGDGIDEVGLFRTSTNNFYLDMDGDYVIDLNGNDLRYIMGAPGDLPISGDWNGDGADEVGLFRPTTNVFYLDVNGNGIIDLQNGDLQYLMGAPGDLPITGDWNGNGADEVGLFRPSTNLFYLDHNGNGIIDISGGDRQHAMGATGDQPLIGRWR